MTYKEKVLKRLNGQIKGASSNTELTTKSGENELYCIDELSATFFKGVITIRFRGVEVPLEKAETSELFTIFKAKYKEFVKIQAALTLEEL